MALEFFPGYPDPMPAFKLLGDQGKNLLESALAQPRQTWNGRYIYRTIYDKAAVLLYSMNKNHPFMDGNKRLALATTVVFLLANFYVLVASTEECVAISLSIANSEITDWKLISKWIRAKSVSMEALVRSDEVNQLEAQLLIEATSTSLSSLGVSHYLELLSLVLSVFTQGQNTLTES